MRFCKSYKFHKGIRGVELGWSFAGQPLMTVYCYMFGSVMIDTGQSHMEKEVVAIARHNEIKRIFLTHHHEDHSGNAAAIQRLPGVDVFGHHLSRKKIRKLLFHFTLSEICLGKDNSASYRAFS